MLTHITLRRKPLHGQSISKTLLISQSSVRTYTIYLLLFLIVHKSFVTGAGLYSFFQNYDGNCESPPGCQSQIFDIDTVSTVNIYDLATVGTQYQLSVNEQGVIFEGPNYNGFQSTIAVWTRVPNH